MSSAEVSPTHRRFDEEHLLDAARTVFHSDGYAAAQTADIARIAGTTRPTLHARLGNKEQIYLRVVEREAITFQSWIAEAYQAGRDAPLHELAEVGMRPIFAFASERTAGFDLLFRGDRTGERPAMLRREVIDGVTHQLTTLIEFRIERFGSTLGSHVTTLAAACIGVAVQVCEHALDHGQDLEAARRVASAFVEASFRHLDLEGTLAPSGASGRAAARRRSR
jgi:AcrR family transcriptional regulator